MTVAEWARDEKILGGSFFFARDVSELNNPALVFATLASQLAQLDQFDSHYKHALYNVLQEDRYVASANLAMQFDGLIRRPLSACQGGQPILIMLDALDECSPENDVKEMLRVMLQLDSRLGGRRLRIFVTSRPEAHIRFVFTSPVGEGHHAKVVLHDIDAKIARNDIQTYLKAEFAEMMSGSRDLPPLPANWPSTSEFDKLLNRCGEFFAFAATAVRFIGDEGIRDPKGQLREILDMVDNRHVAKGINPYLDLDNLYLHILQQSVFKNPRMEQIRRIRIVIATVLCLRKPLRVSDLAKFVSATVVDILNSLHFLHPVILVPGDAEGPVRFFHQSFPEFIQDGARCTDKQFLVNVPSHEDFMAWRCAIANGNMHNLSFHMKEYAREFWYSHFRSGACQDPHEWIGKGSIWSTNGGDQRHYSLNRKKRLDLTWTFVLVELAKACRRLIEDWARADFGKHNFWLYGEVDTGMPTIDATFVKWHVKRRGFL